LFTPSGEFGLTLLFILNQKEQKRTNQQKWRFNGIYIYQYGTIWRWYLYSR